MSYYVSVRTRREKKIVRECWYPTLIDAVIYIAHMTDQQYGIVLEAVYNEHPIGGRGLICRCCMTKVPAAMSGPPGWHALEYGVVSWYRTEADYRWGLERMRALQVPDCIIRRVQNHVHHILRTLRAGIC